MTNVSRVAGLGGNYQKKKIYAEEIVHYLLQHTSTKKQQKNGRGLILIYPFFSQAYQCSNHSWKYKIVWEDCWHKFNS